MNKSRFKDHPNRIYDCYCEVELPNGDGTSESDLSVSEPDSNLEKIESTPYLIDLSDDVSPMNGPETPIVNVRVELKEDERKSIPSLPRIRRRYPHSFKDEEILKSVPQFAYPCPINIVSVTHFSFVLTNVDSKWTFGYCRLAPDTNTCLVMLSHLPWHETFYKIIDQVALLAMNTGEPNTLIEFLRCLYVCELPPPGTSISISYMSLGRPHEFSALCPDNSHIPAISQGRNLAEYFNAFDIDCMIAIFASMLNERRIIVTSRRLDRLSSCVQAANSLIYPMNWQHIFIPILPLHLIDYLSAPMPFLIGVPRQTLSKINIGDLGEVVILHADKNLVQTPFDDVKELPIEVLQNIRSSLRGPLTTDDYGDKLARSFVKALVVLIGGYRDALEFNSGEKITFNFEKFVRTRSQNLQPFLERMLHLQIFLQFVEERLDILNAGEGFNDEFEFEVNAYEDRLNKHTKIQYQEWLTVMKNGGRLLKSLNPAMRLAYKNVRDRSKRAFNDLRVKINDGQQPRPSFVYNRFA